MHASSMDFLCEISDDHLEYVASRLQEKLPYAIKNLYYIKGAQRIRENSKAFENISKKLLPVFYTHPSGLKENCTIFGITHGKVDHTVWFFSFEESLSEVKECLAKTKLIKWENVLFWTVHRELMWPVLDYVAKNDLNLCDNEFASYYWMQKEEALKFDIE